MGDDQGSGPAQEVTSGHIDAGFGRMARGLGAAVPPRPRVRARALDDDLHRGHCADPRRRTRLARALLRDVEARALRSLSDFYVLDLPRHAAARADLLHLLRRRTCSSASTCSRHVNFGALHARRRGRRRHPGPRAERGRIHERDHPRRYRRHRQGPDGGGTVARDDPTGSRCAASSCRRLPG